MYNLLNKNIDLLLNDIKKDSHIDPYILLIEKLKSTDISNENDFKSKYKDYWGMNPARLTKSFYEKYFTFLEKNKENTSLTIEEVVKYLYENTINNKDKKSFQFSFSTKLLHMINSNKPIYDRMVKSFYFLPISHKKSFDEKLENMLKNYNFLEYEYNRIIENRILDNSINKFYEIYNINENNFSKIKVIDSLIWGFANSLEKGQVRDKKVVYK